MLELEYRGYIIKASTLEHVYIYDERFMTEDQLSAYILGDSIVDLVRAVKKIFDIKDSLYRIIKIPVDNHVRELIDFGSYSFYLEIVTIEKESDKKEDYVC